MDSANTLIFSLDDETEILKLLENLLCQGDYDPNIVTKPENLLNVIVKKDVHILIGNLGSQPVSEEEFLSRIIDRNPGMVSALSSGSLDIRFGGINEHKKDGTLYLSRCWDLSSIEKSVKKNHRCCVRIFEEN